MPMAKAYSSVWYMALLVGYNNYAINGYTSDTFKLRPLHC